MVNESLKKYIEEVIFPQYELNDMGHNIDHIRYVIERSLKFAKQVVSINYDMVYVIASYHDIAHHIDKNIRHPLPYVYVHPPRSPTYYYLRIQRLAE